MKLITWTTLLLVMALPSARADTPVPDSASAAPPKKTAQASKATGGSAQKPRLRITSLADAGLSGLVRIKDVADVQGVRGNQLIGYGLVVGLEGTGDSQSIQFTIQSIANMLRSFGINVDQATIRVKNVAAVMVTADLPPFVKNGSHIDVTVSSMGDAKSLQGGTLLQTPLRGADGEVYAAAQGALSIGGFNFGQGGSSVQKNHVNVGRIPRGGYVEAEVPTTLADGDTIQVTLHDPDFTTASRIASAIRRQLPEIRARALDAATVAITVPAGQADDLIGFLARVENVTVTPDSTAKIVVNERTGTVVIGGNVRLMRGAVANGSISIKIENNPVVVPAAPFTKGTQPLVVPQKDTTVTEKTMQLASVPSTTTVDQLVRALNMLGVTPRDLITILQGMRSVGMLPAEIEVQ